MTETEYDKRKVSILMGLVIILCYSVWLGWSFPNALKEQWINVELIERIDQGYSVIAHVSGVHQPQKIHLNLEKYDIDFIIKEDVKYNVIFKSGYIPWRWTVMKIEPYTSRW